MIGSDRIRTEAPGFLFDAFSSREAGSTLLENAPAGRNPIGALLIISLLRQPITHAATLPAHAHPLPPPFRSGARIPRSMEDRASETKTVRRTRHRHNNRHV
ncbi:hypothetical protein I3J27_30005 [Bradyrhizobium xenonodulans]|uniref:Uncharacterized protein n=1 Tax=Bradyrhizobium xenonodulans TaxID=2736875 RepID=A0ABY7MFN5_9BRAD|nr:hypothetical protein [Bradyrhizobium xenonodulans]WBL77228.1 hypothetical protein I3J27_30005 [Bradyrhizobium xenonodulans]